MRDVDIGHVHTIAFRGRRSHITVVMRKKYTVTVVIGSINNSINVTLHDLTHLVLVDVLVQLESSLVEERCNFLLYAPCLLK